MILIRLSKLFLVEQATCAMWNLSLIKQQNGKLLEGDRIFYRTKCSNFQHISQRVFLVCLHFILCQSDFFFLCPLSAVFWLRPQSLSASSPDLLVTASSLFLRLWLGLVMGAWQAFPGEEHSVLLQWTRPRMTSEQSWPLPASAGFL